MELKIDLAYDQLFTLIKQLPYEHKIKLFKDLLPEINSSKIESSKENTYFNDFQKLLLNGPFMTDEQYDNYKDLRKNFNSWLEASSV